ncbi:MAG: Phospho-N-acetylmuramoyl-pentapeptide-transferase [bacterium ADurb.Bin243]|nr:MAG: Phospho-N-acetylmuramoyl-pentapeptide-transferase [bacterium ADurb.Bin243]HOD40075.1 phospho-N-acetylmuramoyl-pentapeptide-transferase [Candidatus Wallbacteria bacterium]
MFHYFLSGAISQLTAMISVRTLFSVLTSFIITLLLVPIVIKNIQSRKAGQNVRKLGPESHYQKAGRPTMGGIAMVIAICVTSLIWCQLNEFVIIMLISTVWLGMVGFLDDMLKFTKKSSDGLSAKAKMALILILGIGAGWVIYSSRIMPSTLFVPVLNTEFQIGWFYVLFVTFIISSWSNAVNLTDGLDGLAIGIVILVALALGGVAYLTGNVIFSKHVGLPFVRGAGELTVYCASLVGAGLGFYWYNASPAEIFMGDVGSLALGGALGLVSVFTKSELLLAVIGGIFVVEALSVMIQVFSFKYFGRRVFKMSPIHHHFELSGWPETKVVARFWVITIVLIIAGLCILGLNTILASKGVVN